MSTTDRMGGFISVRIIETKNIESFTVLGETVKITPKSENDFFEIIPKKYGIVPTISSSQEKSGTIYSINVQISAINPTGLKLISFNKFIVICKNPMEKEFVFGTNKFPLTGIKQHTVSETAAGATGETLVFSGKQPVNPLILTK